MLERDKSTCLSSLPAISESIQRAGLVSILVFLGSAARVEGQALRFSDQTQTSGIDNTYQAGGFYHHYAGGGAVGDFDGDGWQDLFIPGSMGEPDRLFINDGVQHGEASFSDRGEEWGLHERHTGVGTAVGDYNSDGWLDVFVTSLGPWDGWTPGHHKLYRNNGGKSFTDVAGQAGVNLTVDGEAGDFGASFGDPDLDGDLDLFVLARAASVLFRNNGDETFTDITLESGLFVQGESGEEPLQNGFTANFVDMDGDRYPELLFVADRQRSKYFQNNGDGTFTDLTLSSGTGKEEEGMGQTLGDFNGDGLLDWYVTSIHNLPRKTGNKLYLNQGNHSYEEVAKFAGVDAGELGWGALAVDFDHDGWLDLAETNGEPSQSFKGTPSFLWMNNGDGTFSEKSAPLGFEHYTHGRGMLSFDCDNDGDQDVIIFENGAPAVLLRNDLDGAQSNWLRVFLDTRGRHSTSKPSRLAPNGFGSKVVAVAGGKTLVRWIYGGESYLSKSELSAHFGLGSAAVIDELRVEWSDGDVTLLNSLAANQTITISPGKSVAGTQKPGDCDQDGRLDLSDAICLLVFLFDERGVRLPCSNGSSGDHRANLLLLDSNADDRVDPTDALRVLGYLFLGKSPPALGTGCVLLSGCPENVTKCAE